MRKLAAIRLFATVLPLLFASSAILAVEFPSASSASPGAEAGWSSGTPIDPLLGQPTSVSCPTASFCAAVDSHGGVVIYDGSSWSIPVSIDAGNDLTSVSCPTASFCAAVDSRGGVVTYNGTSWSSPVTIDASVAGPDSISCPTASFCAVVDQLGNVLTYNGTAWSSLDTIDPGNALFSVSCPTASLCVAVDEQFQRLYLQRQLMVADRQQHRTRGRAVFPLLSDGELLCRGGRGRHRRQL